MREGKRDREISRRGGHYSCTVGIKPILGLISSLSLLDTCLIPVYKLRQLLSSFCISIFSQISTFLLDISKKSNI